VGCLDAGFAMLVSRSSCQHGFDLLSPTTPTLAWQCATWPLFSGMLKNR